MSPAITAGRGGGSASHLQIIQNEKFYSRVLSKEESANANPSFRVYYGGASGSVPFLWESRPGTPKHPMGSSPLPAPLTPPPSYHPLLSPNLKKDSPKPPTKLNLFQSILPALSLRSLPSASHRRGRSSFSWSSSSSADGENDDSLSPTSTLCFGGTSIRKTFLSVARGSSRSQIRTRPTRSVYNSQTITRRKMVITKNEDF